MPCSRCVDVSSECVYADERTERPEQMYVHIRAWWWKGARTKTGVRDREDRRQLSDRLHDLNRLVRSVQDELSQLTSTSTQRPSEAVEPQRMPPSPTPTEMGATRHLRLSRRRRQSSLSPKASQSSSETMLKLAQSSLVDNGTIPSIDAGAFSVTPPSEDAAADTAAMIVQAGRSILALGYQTAHSLVDTYVANVCVMYPCVDITTIRSNLTSLYHLASTHARAAALSLGLVDVEILKAVLAVGACAKLAQPSPLAQTLQQSLLWNVESVYCQDEADIEDVVMSCLMCILYIQQDERRKAWRMAGFCARTALELGLDVHEPNELRGPLDSVSESPGNTTQQQRERLLFCCVYDLDIRSSFMIGLPRVMFAHLQPHNVLCLQSPPYDYLRAMVEMDRLGADIIALLKKPDQGSDSFETRMDYVEYRLKIMEDSKAGSQESATPTVVQLFTRLRAIHLRLLAHLRVLSSASMDITRPRSIEALVSAAEAIVGVCKTTMDSASIPALLRATFVHFLMAAVSSMVLAALYDRSRYHTVCRQPFEAGLEILEAWERESSSVHPRQRYSLTNLRKHGQKSGILDDETVHLTWSNGESLSAARTPLTLQGLSWDPNPDPNWNFLLDDAFTLGQMNTQSEPWDQKWFDLVLGSFDAGVGDNEQRG
ncbi:hypothetical protein LTS10_002662 [Elasticomyces elasticus]|nr:hypothetical protein LTS10_002662 [Elasticomyces elasticus]